MTAMVLRWRVPTPAIQTRWRGPQGMIAAVERVPATPIAAIIAQGGSASLALSRTAGEALGGHRAVVIKADDKAWYVSPGDVTDDAAIGLTLGAAALGAAVSILPVGEIEEAGWSWSEGPVFLAADGMLTQNIPTTAAIVRIGTAAGPTRMVVNPRLIAKL